jgi:hypothetical protein
MRTHAGCSGDSPWWLGRSVEPTHSTMGRDSGEATTAYHGARYGDGWGGGVPRWPGHGCAAQLAALLHGHRRVTTPLVSPLAKIV